MALGTGARFPTPETAIDDDFLRHAGCREGTARAGAWRDVRLTSTARIARTPTMRTDRMSCWAQLAPFDIELGGDKVELYLEEIQATPQVRQRWHEQRQRGLTWKERYTKHARIELAGTWLLRGTDLRPADHMADAWESRFVTLTFEVASRAHAARVDAGQNLNNSRSNIRSTSQTVATSAITTEPALNTTR